MIATIRLELEKFLTQNENHSLNAFIQKNEKLIAATNHFNDWQQLKSYWNKAYKEAYRKIKPQASKLIKSNVHVEASVWQDLYLKINNNGQERIKDILFKWCQATFKNENYDEDLTEVTAEVSRLEEASRSLKEEVTVLSYKLLSSFDSLTLVEKCILKLAVSDTVDLNNKAFFDQYKKYFSIRNMNELLLLEAPRPQKQNNDEVRQEFRFFKKLFFDDERGPDFLPSAKKGLKDQICLIMLNLLNIMNNWADDDSTDEEEDDDDDNKEEEEEEERKRKREPECSENDLLLVVKMILDSIFGDTKLKWKSGEKTTEATKRARVVGQLLSGSRSCSNLMGRRSDLVLYNKKNVVLCLSELKDGNSKTESTKSLRCTKSLSFYNKPLSQKDLWSLDWNGFDGYTYYSKSHEGITVVLPGNELAIPTSKDCIDDLEDTLVALYEFKEHMLEYDASLTLEFTASESEEMPVYHSPQIKHLYIYPIPYE